MIDIPIRYTKEYDPKLLHWIHTCKMHVVDMKQLVTACDSAGVPDWCREVVSECIKELGAQVAVSDAFMVLDEAAINDRAAREIGNYIGTEVRLSVQQQMQDLDKSGRR
jgi:hypothetical protein